MDASESMEIPRDTTECFRGRFAFDAGVDHSECPYPTGHPHRVGWLAGWYDRRTNQRLGRVFARSGITHP